MTVPSRNQWAGKKVEESILWVGIKKMLPCFLHCNALILLIALCSCFSCGVCYHRHFISPFQESSLFALVQNSLCKMTPFTPKWDKCTSAVIVHWDKVGALCFYLLPWATTSAATATSRIHQWHWSENKHCTVPEFSCSEPRYRCRLIYATPNWQVCRCWKKRRKQKQNSTATIFHHCLLLEQGCLFSLGHYVKCEETLNGKNL